MELVIFNQRWDGTQICPTPGLGPSTWQVWGYCDEYASELTLSTTHQVGQVDTSSGGMRHEVRLNTGNTFLLVGAINAEGESNPIWWAEDKEGTYRA